MLFEERGQCVLALFVLFQQSLVNDVANICWGQVDSQFFGKAIFHFDQEGIIRILINLLLPDCDQPRSALHLRAKFRCEGPQTFDPVGVPNNVLRHFVDHQE